VDEWERRQRLM